MVAIHTRLSNQAGYTPALAELSEEFSELGINPIRLRRKKTTRRWLLRPRILEIRCLFNPHIVLDRRYALDTTGNLDCTIGLSLRTDKSAELNDTLVGLDVNLCGLQRWLIKNRSLHFGRYDAVIHILSGAFTFIR